MLTLGGTFQDSRIRGETVSQLSRFANQFPECPAELPQSGRKISASSALR